MRYVVTPQFAAKLVSLSVSDTEKVRDAIDLIESLSVSEMTAHSNLSAIGGTDVYMFRNGSIRLFVSFAENDDGPYVLLADVLTRDSLSSSRDLGGSRGNTQRRNPRTDSRINPKLNNRINPKLNARINPKLNSRINPKINSRLNPKLNSRINPKMNSRINPKLNSRINPKLNSSINPALNPSVNPHRNSLSSARFVYNLDLNEEGYCVHASENVILVFDQRDRWIGFAVQQSMEGYVIFDLDLAWVGHWERNGEGGFNRFSLENQWIGFVV